MMRRRAPWRHSGYLAACSACAVAMRAARGAGLDHGGYVVCTSPVMLPWELSTKPPPDVITGYKWELYNVQEDPTEFNDLAAKMPEKLKQMQDLFYSEAKKYDVLPLDNSTLAR
jgi:hypothetical protein